MYYIIYMLKSKKPIKISDDLLKSENILIPEKVNKITKNKKTTTTKSHNVMKIIFDYSKDNTTIEF